MEGWILSFVSCSYRLLFDKGGKICKRSIFGLSNQLFFVVVVLLLLFFFFFFIYFFFFFFFGGGGGCCFFFFKQNPLHVNFEGFQK